MLPVGGKEDLNMNLRWRHLALGMVLMFGLTACVGTGSEPTEAQMKEAMEYYLNHPPGVAVSDPIKIAFFKKEACDDPTKQGFSCTFTVTVSSRNAFAQMYNNLPRADFYKNKESGKWAMRPPF
jgi:hypothetical protein